MRIKSFALFHCPIFFLANLSLLIQYAGGWLELGYQRSSCTTCTTSKCIPIIQSKDSVSFSRTSHRDNFDTHECENARFGPFLTRPRHACLSDVTHAIETSPVYYFLDFYLEFYRLRLYGLDDSGVLYPSASPKPPLLARRPKARPF